MTLQPVDVLALWMSQIYNRVFAQNAIAICLQPSSMSTCLTKYYSIAAKFDSLSYPRPLQIFPLACTTTCSWAYFIHRALGSRTIRQVMNISGLHDSQLHLKLGSGPCGFLDLASLLTRARPWHAFLQAWSIIGILNSSPTWKRCYGARSLVIVQTVQNVLSRVI